MQRKDILESTVSTSIEGGKKNGNNQMSTISKWIDELYAGRRHGREKERSAAAKTSTYECHGRHVEGKGKLQKTSCSTTAFM